MTISLHSWLVVKIDVDIAHVHHFQRSSHVHGLRPVNSRLVFHYVRNEDLFGVGYEFWEGARSDLTRMGYANTWAYSRTDALGSEMIKHESRQSNGDVAIYRAIAHLEPSEGRADDGRQPLEHSYRHLVFKGEVDCTEGSSARGADSLTVEWFRKGPAEKRYQQDRLVLAFHGKK